MSEISEKEVIAYKTAFGEYMDKVALGRVTPPTPDVGFHACAYALEAAAHARAEAVGVKDREDVAKLIYGAMTWAAVESPKNGVIPVWMDGGNSHAQTEARRCADRILAALAHSAVPEGWQDIASAPKDGRLILVATEGQKVGSPAWTGMYCAYWNNAEHLWLFHRSGYVPNPTHWMPLPKPPVAAAEKEVRG